MGDERADDGRDERAWDATAWARAGLAGNPSDALGGAALAVAVPALNARVRLRSADSMSVRGPSGEGAWRSLDDLDSHVRRFGHEGAERLVTATIITIWRRLRRDGVTALDPSPFEVEWASDIPRSVGLAGSSALVVATIRALVTRWGLDLDPVAVASLALSVERDELGIAAGWMDRAVQAYDAAVLVDCAAQKGQVPVMRVVHPARHVEVLVAWDRDGAAPSNRLHSSLAERLAAGDAVVRDGVDALVEVARRGAAALEMGDVAGLAAAVDESCELRRHLGALDVVTARLVEVARSGGGSATSAGSGGAVSVVGEVDRLADIADAFHQLGVSSCRVTVR